MSDHDRLAEAARAYLAALAEETAAKAELEAAKARRAATRAKVVEARTPLAEAIVSEARSGTRQKDILAAIDGAYTRESVRRICRAAGVEPGDD